MSRSNYSEDYGEEFPGQMELYRATVDRSISGRRGQDFLRAVAREMDAMPVKRLIAGELVTRDGECCTMGVICKARGLDTSKIDYEIPSLVAKKLGISTAMAGEIAFENDEAYGADRETPEERWTRMRAWVESKLEREGP